MQLDVGRSRKHICSHSRAVQGTSGSTNALQLAGRIMPRTCSRYSELPHALVAVSVQGMLCAAPMHHTCVCCRSAVLPTAKVQSDSGLLLHTGVVQRHVVLCRGALASSGAVHCLSQHASRKLAQPQQQQLQSYSPCTAAALCFGCVSSSSGWPCGSSCHSCVTARYVARLGRPSAAATDAFTSSVHVNRNIIL
jgi:hypothetical protein